MSASWCKALAMTAPVMLMAGCDRRILAPAGLRAIDGLQTVPGGAHDRLRGDVELLVDLGDLPGFAEPVHADEAALQAEVAVPAHLHRRFDRHPGESVAQHGLLVARI